MTRTTGPAEPSPRSAELEARINALEMELAQKDALLTQGFDVFTDAAEKLQDSYKRLQKKVDELNLELDRKNKELELNLEEKEKVKTYLSNIFSSLAIGVVVTSLDGRVTGLNRTLVEMLGVTDEQARGMTVGGLLGVDISLPDLESGGLAGRKSNEEELDEPITYTSKDRDPLKLQISASTMRGENGEPLGFIFNIQDVTELKRLEEHADRRNRFTAMGEMAANIAHEIRNPLGSIELFAALLKKGLAEDADKVNLLDHISSSISSMNHIISNLLAYTKPRAVIRQKIHLHELLRDGAAFSSVMAAHNNVEVKLNLNADHTQLLADPEQMKQVFTNLFINAVQAMPEGGRLTISTRLVTLDSPKLLSRFKDGGARAGRFLEVSFQDTGHGIPKEIVKKIFDPFFTSKSQGTGLGLAIVHSILESHGAAIEVESQENKGTRIVMTLPLLKDQT